MWNILPTLDPERICKVEEHESLNHNRRCTAIQRLRVWVIKDDLEDLGFFW